MKHKVLTVGPSVKAKGGIASVLEVYSRTVPDFTFLPTNSAHGKIAGYLNMLATLAALPFYRLRGYDILHAHGAAGKSFVRKNIVLSWARALDFRTIYHMHAGGFPDYARRIGFDKARRKLAACDRVVVLARTWRSFYERELGLENVSVIENIVEQPAAIAPADSHPHTPVRFLFLGKICKEKGLYDLLDAVAALKRAGVAGFKVAIGGVGETETFHRKVAELALQNEVEYLGWVDAERKHAEFMRADVVLLPSYFEGMPICLLEAGVYGLPSVATGVGAVPELIADKVNGLLIPVGDAAAIDGAMKFYIENPDAMRRHGAEALGRLEAYKPENVIQELAKLYDSF